MASPGTPMDTRMVTITGNDPPGTPAVPMPARIQRNTTVIWEARLNSTLKHCARNNTVIPSNKAVPFWLAVLRMVNRQLAIGLGTFNFSMLTAMAVGRVALLELVEKAVIMISLVFLKNCRGLRPAKNFRMIE